MSEIKSTLDLVMERTKNLTMNADEKEKQRETDLKRRLAGLIQKFQDQAIRTSQLFQRLDELKKTFGPTAEKQMTTEILKNVHVESDNKDRLVLLKDYFGLDVTPLEKTLADCDRALQDLLDDHVDRLKLRLSDRYRISGSAVIPNVETGPDWPEKRSTIIEEFRVRLDTEKNRLADR